MNAQKKAQRSDFLENNFLAVEVDLRKIARCQVQNYLLFIISDICLVSLDEGRALLPCPDPSKTMVDLFATDQPWMLQLGSKHPLSLQPNFMPCQVACCTECKDSPSDRRHYRWPQLRCQAQVHVNHLRWQLWKVVMTHYPEDCIGHSQSRF